MKTSPIRSSIVVNLYTICEEMSRWDIYEWCQKHFQLPQGSGIPLNMSENYEYYIPLLNDLVSILRRHYHLYVDEVFVEV